MDRSGSSTGRDEAPGGNVSVGGERRRLKLEPRTKPTKTSNFQGGSTARKSSIFGEGKAHDEFAYEASYGMMFEMKCSNGFSYNILKL